MQPGRQYDKNNDAFDQSHPAPGWAQVAEQQGAYLGNKRARSPRQSGTISNLAFYDSQLRRLTAQRGAGLMTLHPNVAGHDGEG